MTQRKVSAIFPSVEYVTITKAAEMLGVSRPTVYKMIADGKIKMRQFVGRPAISISEINKRANGAGRPRKESK